MAKTETVTYGEIRNGDRVYVQGYRFIVENVHVAARAGDRRLSWQEPLTDDVIRFTGRCADDCGISRTGYNGGTYGGYAFVKVMREVNE